MYRRTFLAVFLITLGTLGIFAPNCHAQGVTGSLVGMATDPSGLRTAGVRIAATHNATGQQFRTITGNTGEYVLPGPPLGSYLVEAEKEGFKKSVRDNAQVLQEEKLRVDFNLEIGA